MKALAVLLLWLFLASALLLLWNLPANTVKVLVQVRIPELVLSVAYGGILGVGGCVYQSVVKNPLADPHILGVSAGGALGAVLATAVGLNPEGFALAGGLLATWLVYMVAKLLKNSLKLLLFGVALNMLLSACIFLAYALTPALGLAKAMSTTLGFIPALSLEESTYILLVSLSLLAVLLKFHKAMDSLSLGDELSYFSGVLFEREGAILLALASAGVSIAVAKAGIIGFLGIVGPHTARFLGFRAHRHLLPTAYLGGGAFLATSQAVARNVAYPTVLPAGVVASLIGIPLFVYILWRYSGA